MIVDSQDKFERAIALAMNADSQIYESMESFLRNADNWIRTTLLGTPLYQEVDTMPEDLTRQIELVISLRAFIEAIPFLDLVLTPTGFGIVSNNNLAPASKDRVDRLQKRAQYTLDDAVDTLIWDIYDSAFCEKWREGEAFPVLTSSLIWTAEELRLYAGKPGAHRSTLLDLRPQITAAEQAVSMYISVDYMEELTGKLQQKLLQDKEKGIIRQLQKIIGFFLQGMNNTAEIALCHLVNLMEAHPEEFGTYHNSEEYKLKHTPVYENKKEDSCFFFG